MARYLLQRIFSAVFVLWLVISLTFLLMHAIPGGPFSSEKQVPEAVLKNLNERYHINDPLSKQYVDYLKNIAQFNLGPTFRYEGRTVNDLVKEGLPKTATIGFFATLFAVGGGLILGIIAALWQNKVPDIIATFITLISSYPQYWAATTDCASLKRHCRVKLISTQTTLAPAFRHHIQCSVASWTVMAKQHNAIEELFRFFCEALYSFRQVFESGNFLTVGMSNDDIL